MQSLSWILWNLGLAASPVLLAILWTTCIRRFSQKRHGIHWIAFTPLVILWIAFLPNTCYLVTEWRHFFFDPYFVRLRDVAETNHVYMISVARQGLFFLLYSAFGVLCLMFAIRPVDQLLAKNRVSKLLWMPPLFILTSIGVYLGLMVRLNSWEIVTRPLRVWDVTLNALTSPLLLKTIAIFAFLLWACYEITNIWADGLMLRLRRRQASKAAE